MWNFKYRDEYLPFVEDLLAHPDVCAMRQLPQHAKGFSCFHHSLLVSYLSFRLCRALGLDMRSAARGGLLHDLYLYNWQDKSTHPHVNHAFDHPLVALENAQARFPLNPTEADIIATHMFPLAITRPHHCLESVVVGAMDKLCAVAELLRLTPPVAEEAPVTLLSPAQSASLGRAA